MFTAVYLDPAGRTAVTIFTNATASAEARAALKAIAVRLFESA